MVCYTTTTTTLATTTPTSFPAGAASVTTVTEKVPGLGRSETV